MALRLELKLTKGALEGIQQRRWYFEHGRRTIGRATDCDWQIPDSQRLVSKLHCTIEADREGFVLHDKSANGSKVDGRLVVDGESARLVNGSVIEIGGFAFSVLLTGEKDPELDDPDAGLRLGDENLTISSILADVAPSSPRSSGLRGSHEAWPDTGSGEDERPRNAPSSRNVEIGWRGPPEPDAIKPLLPMDWDQESDYSSTLEHSPATRVSVPISRDVASPVEPAPDAQSSASEPIPEPSAPAEPVAAPPIDRQPGNDAPAIADVLQSLELLAGRCEKECIELLAVFGLETEIPAPGRQVLGLPREEALLARLEAVLSIQQTLRLAAGGLLDDLGRSMEPASVEAQVNAQVNTGPAAFFRRGDGAYWQAYKARFEKDGARLSLRDVFRDAMLTSLRGGATSDIADLQVNDDIEVNRQE